MFRNNVRLKVSLIMRKNTGLTLTFLIFALVVPFTVQYKPIIFMHGIIGSPTEAEYLISILQKVHPGTQITAVNAFNRYQSFEPLWEQVNNITKIVQPIMNSSPDGVHLICFSQGGLICRGLLSVLEHNVDTFIALSSPLAGQYGDTDYLKDFFPYYLKETIYKYFYTKNGQKWSVANYWRDPHHTDLYHEFSSYLYKLDSGQNSNYRNNFVRLKKLVLIGGPDDGVITPWQSSHFGFYDGNEKIKEMRNQEYFLNDTFGLKELDGRGAIDTHVIPGVEHVHWYRNSTVFNKYIEPYLT
ncbi:lysosomal thioesterase PPT2-A-like [Mytilus edulis]|uniref:lysosomal thioesterase PPT2-A-like n=1 Tax=Mytilus edulis TaxID=6550 RepID=UPI0039EF93D7